MTTKQNDVNKQNEKNTFGRPTDYKPEYCQYVEEKMRDEGYIVEQFCRDWSIDVTTFYEWLKVHPSFSQSYTRGKNYRKAYNKELLATGVYHDSFNERAYAMLLRYSGETIDERVIKLPELANCKSFNEQSSVIVGAVACGKITIKEANGYIDIIAKTAKIDEVTELRATLKELESLVKK